MNPDRLPRALRPFADGRYRLLLVALTMSLFGGGVWLVAMVGTVFHIGGGPIELSVIATGNAVGMIVAVLLGGAIADRVRQQRVLLWVEIARTLVIGGVIVLALSETLQIWNLAIASTLLGLAEGIFYPAFTALLPRILPADRLLAANGIEGMVRPLAHDALGPALGGLAIAAWSPVGAFVLIGLTQLVAVGLLLGLRDVAGAPVAVRTAGRSAVGSFFGDIGAGFAYVAKTPWLLWTLLYACLVVFIMMGPLEVLVPFAVRDHAGGGTIEYSLVLTAFGVGAAVGSLVMASLRMPRRYLTLLNVMWGASCIPLVVFGFVEHVWIMILAGAICGGLSQASMVIWGTLLQRRVPTELLGRVSSLDFFVSLVLMPVSMAVAGPVGEAVGLLPVFLVAGLVPIVFAATAILVARMPRDEIEHPLDDRGIEGPTPATAIDPAVRG